MKLIQKVSTIENLNKSWRALKSGKSDDARRALRGIDGISIQKFSKNACQNIITLSNQLNEGTYKVSPLKAFFLKKTDKKEYRLIAPPSVSDAIVHHSILRELKPIFHLMLNNGVSYCGIPGLSKKKRVNHVVALRNLHKAFQKGDTCVFESDIKGFFDGISKDLLLNRLLPSLPDDSLNNILYDIIYFEIGNYSELVAENKGYVPSKDSPYGVAQGSPLSPFFSNIYLSDFDYLMNQIADSKLFRYVDDFVIVGNSIDEVVEIGGIAEHLLNAEFLSLASEKTATCNLSYPNECFNFLGLKISKFEVQQKKPLAKVLEIMEKEYLRLHAYEDNLDMLVSAPRRVEGYGNYYRCFHTIPMLKAVNKLIDKKKKILSILKTLNF